MPPITTGDLDEITSDVPLDYSVYRDKWSETYSDKFNDVLQSVDTDTFDAVLDFTGIEQSEGSVFSQLRTKNQHSIFLYSLYRFIDDKRLAIQELAARNEEPVEAGEEFKYIIRKIIGGDTDAVFHLYLYEKWLKSNNKSRYNITTSIPEDYKSRFDENALGIRMTLSRRTRGQNFRYTERGKLEFPDGTIFALSRQTSDNEKQDITGPQRRRDEAHFFVAVDEDKEELVIDSKSNSIRDALHEKIKEEFSILTEEADLVGDKSQISISQFADEFSNDADGQNIEIWNVEFRKTNTQPPLPLTLSKKSEAEEVRAVLKELSEELLDTQITNIRRFWFSWNGVETRVTVEENVERNFLRLNADVKSLSETRTERIHQEFHETFGLPLNKKIPLHWVTKRRSRLIAQMLKGVSATESRYIQDGDLLDKMVNDIGVIKRKEIYRKQCEGCRNIYKSDRDKCNKCGGNLEVVQESFELEMDESGIDQYFRNQVKTEDLTYYEKKTEGIYGNKFKFYQIGDGENIVRVLLNSSDVNITPGTVDYLRKSLHPVLVLNPGTILDEKLIEEVTSESLDLSYIIDNDLSGTLEGGYIRERFEKVARNSEKRVAGSAIDSYEHIRQLIQDPDSDEGGEFEQDVFHILKQVVPTLEQWGEKRTGNQPDGFGELFFYNGNQKWFRSFAYDGKYTSSEELTIPTKEAVRLQNYAGRILSSDEVSSSESKFRNFIVVTNANPGNFGSVCASRLNRIRVNNESWKGVPVLMRVDFLLGLHVGYNENSEVIKENIHTFYEQLYLTLNGGQRFHRDTDDEFFVHLTKEDSLELIENFEREAETDRINITSLREFLEEDILRVSQ